MSSVASLSIRNATSKAYRVKVIDPRIPRQDLRLLYQYDAEGLLVVISQAQGVRQLFFPAEVVGRDLQAYLADLTPAQVAARCQSSLDVMEIDLTAFFNNVAILLDAVREQGQLPDYTYEALHAALQHSVETLDIDYLKEFFQLEHREEILDACLVYKLTDEEEAFWRVVWQTIVKKAKDLESDLLKN